MNTAVLYTDGGLESERAGQLLRSLGGEYLEYRLGQHFTPKQFTDEFGESAEFPQVSIGYEHIGGLKDTLHYFQDRGLL